MKKGVVIPTRVVRLKVSTTTALEKEKERPDETLDTVIWRLIQKLRRIASGGLID